MKTFSFNESNGNASLILSEIDYEKAVEYIRDLGLNPDDWQCEDEEGEDDE